MSAVSPSDLIEQALEDEYSGEEEQLIDRLLEKKHYDAETMDQKEKQRIYQYLMRRGFRPEDYPASNGDLIE